MVYFCWNLLTPPGYNLLALRQPSMLSTNVPDRVGKPSGADVLTPNQDGAGGRRKRSPCFAGVDPDCVCCSPMIPEICCLSVWFTLELGHP